MTVLSELKSQGWHLSTEGLELCSENRNNPSASSIIRKALDMDLREIGGNFLPEDMTKGKTEYISGPGVVQIQKIKNASAPKYEYGTGAPPLLRLLLTDGSNYINCLQWGHWRSVSLDTPPGTKLYLKPVKIPLQSNFLLLSDHQFTVLGGCVTTMVEKWELQRKLASHIRTKDNLDGTGPPPWTPFGQQIVGVKQAKLGSNFRALDAESKEAKEDAVFKQQRQAVIAEVSRVKETKAKSFGGRKEFQKTAPEYAPYSQQSNDHCFNTDNPPRKQSVPDDSPIRSRSYVNERNQRRGPPTTRNDPPSQQGSRGPPRSSATPQASSPFVKDNNNKLENKNKLGDFITLEIRQQHTTKPPSDTDASRTRYAPINKDYNRPPDSRRAQQKNLVNAMEQVKIHGYDAEDDGRGLITAAGSFLVPGTEVMAKYWEDGQYYRALVHAVGKDGKTCVVHFLDYGNYEEILITDIQEKSPPTTTFHDRNWNAGPISFQPSSRGGNYENYPSSPNQNYRDGTKPHQQNANRSYNRPDDARGPRSEYRPSAKIYKPPGQRTFNP